jgi:hypothetical protein
MIKSKPSHVERLRSIFDTTIENYSNVAIEDINEIDYYVLMCKAIEKNQIHKMFNCNLFAFTCQINGDDSVIIIFCIPISTQAEVPDKKHSSERIMDIIKTVEECFISIDYMSLKEVKENKFSYLTIIKKIKESE